MGCMLAQASQPAIRQPQPPSRFGMRGSVPPPPPPPLPHPSILKAQAQAQQAQQAQRAVQQAQQAQQAAQKAQLARQQAQARSQDMEGMGIQEIILVSHVWLLQPFSITLQNLTIARDICSAWSVKYVK